MKNIETEIREYAQVLINKPESEHPISFKNLKTADDYINYLELLLAGKFRFNVADFDLRKIAQEELNK
jgi:hypothetical protein